MNLKVFHIETSLSFQPSPTTYKHFLLFLRMHYWKYLFEIYVKGSFHVALMALCFYQINCLQWSISPLHTNQIFVFSLVFMGYNGIRYYPFKLHTKSTPWLYWVIIPTSAITLLFSLWQFISLSGAAQLLVFICFILSIGYVIPLSWLRKSLRSYFGLKIFIVALCWVLLTAVYPLLSIHLWVQDHYLFFIEYLLLIFVAVLPFEIRDSLSDTTALGTVPQLIGIKNTRYLGVFILILLLTSKLLRQPFFSLNTIVFMAMLTAYVFFLFRVKQGDSENITLFWAEAVPALGWFIHYLNS